jgi:hypothetical protein
MGVLEPFRHLVTSSRRIQISAEDSQTGSRIGGNAPEGVRPETETSATRYLLTLALNEVTEVSLFHSIELDDGTNPNYLYKNVSKLQPPESRIVQCVVHSSAARSSSTDLRSDLIGRALVIEPESPDIVVEPGGELLLGSKVGGRPYYFYGTLSYIESLNRLFEQGFSLVMQYTDGGYPERGYFNSPFDEYTFHLLAKDTSQGIVWRYGWG